MKLLILASVLFLISFSVSTYGNEDEGNRTKFEYKYFNFREHLNSPEHLRRKMIMYENESFNAALYRRTTESPPIQVTLACKAVVMARNEFLIFVEECPTEYLDQMVVMYMCHLRDQDNKATSEFQHLGAFIVKVTPDDDGLTMRLKITDPADECVVFTASEMMGGYFPFPRPYRPSSCSPNENAKRSVFDKIYFEANKANLDNHDEL